MCVLCTVLYIYLSAWHYCKYFLGSRTRRFSISYTQYIPPHAFFPYLTFEFIVDMTRVATNKIIYILKTTSCFQKHERLHIELKLKIYVKLRAVLFILTSKQVLRSPIADQNVVLMIFCLSCLFLHHFDAKRRKFIFNCF